jgi:hypothetical protein
MKQLLNTSLKKTIISVVFLSLLSACTTTPLRIPFPDPPAELMTSPPPLKQLPENDNVALSDVEKVIAENYGQYFLMSEQLKSLQTWAKDQKELNP